MNMMTVLAEEIKKDYDFLRKEYNQSGIDGIQIIGENGFLLYDETKKHSQLEVYYNPNNETITVNAALHEDVSYQYEVKEERLTISALGKIVRTLTEAKKLVLSIVSKENYRSNHKEVESCMTEATFMMQANGFSLKKETEKAFVFEKKTNVVREEQEFKLHKLLLATFKVVETSMKKGKIEFFVEMQKTKPLKKSDRVKAERKQVKSIKAYVDNYGKYILLDSENKRYWKLNDIDEEMEFFDVFQLFEPNNIREEGSMLLLEAMKKYLVEKYKNSTMNTAYSQRMTMILKYEELGIEGFLKNERYLVQELQEKGMKFELEKISIGDYAVEIVKDSSGHRITHKLVNI